MAAAVTLSGDWLHSLGSLRAVVASVAFDNSYPTGGESIAASKFGLGKIEFLIAQSTGGYIFAWDNANSKLLAYYGDNNNAADGPLIEVPNATDLAALTAVPVLVFGR